MVGEGAGVLVLEDFESAKARGATVLGEICGYGTNCDGTHVTAPSSEGMAGAMRLALGSAGLAAADIDYVNAHGTATEAGDIAESHATLSVMGADVPFSSTKGHTGHTLGACGGIELIFCLGMLADGFVPETRNLTQADPRCAGLDYVVGEPRRMDVNTVMSNNFAFGGINTSLIVRRV